MYRIRIKLGGVLGDLHMSRRDLADLCDMRPGTAGDWVNGIIEHINLVHLAAICEVLELEVQDVIVLDKGGVAPDPVGREERIRVKVKQVRTLRRKNEAERRMNKK